MEHQNLENVYLMFRESGSKKSNYTIKLNVRKGTEVRSGDLFILNNAPENKNGYEILSVENSRQSSMSGFDHVTCTAIFRNLKNE